MLLDKDEEYIVDEDTSVDASSNEITGVMAMALEDYAMMEAAYGDLRVAQCVDEFAMYKQNGEIVDEAAASSFLAKVKAFFQKLWSTIKSFWAKLVDKLRAWFVNSEKFYAANKAKIAAGAGRVKGFKGYKYGNIQQIATNVQKAAAAAAALANNVTSSATFSGGVKGAASGAVGAMKGGLNTIKTQAGNAANAIKKNVDVAGVGHAVAGTVKSLGRKVSGAPGAAVQGARQGAADAAKTDTSMRGVAGVEIPLDKLRVQLCGKPGAADFKNNLIARYRGTEKVELSAGDVPISDLAVAGNINKSISLAAKASDNFMKGLINKVDAMGKTGMDQGDVSRKVAFLKGAAQIFHTAMSVCASLMAASLNQAKAFAIAAVRAAGSEASKTESAGYVPAYEDDGMSYFSENGIKPIGGQEEDNGIYVDEEGYLVNAYGQYVDEEGNLIEG